MDCVGDLHLSVTEATVDVSPWSNGSYVGFYSSLSTANEMAGVFHEVFASDVLKRLIQEDLQELAKISER